MVSDNPYSRPPDEPKRVRPGHDPPTPEALVSGPANGLMLTSFVFLLITVYAFLLTVVHLIGAMGAQMPGPAGKETSLIIRLCVGVVLIGVNSFILSGAIRMKRMENFHQARTISILACIPLIGPCFLLGIPFGLWSLDVLHRPGVREKFVS